MIVSYIPTCLLEEESITELRDKGVSLEEGSIKIGTFKVNCIKVYNLTETQVFDKLNTEKLYESTDTQQKTAYASRCMSVIFQKIRQVQAIKDKDLRITACCSLLAAVNAVAAVDVKTADRFIPLIRSIN